MLHPTSWVRLTTEEFKISANLPCLNKENKVLLVRNKYFSVLIFSSKNNIVNTLKIDSYYGKKLCSKKRFRLILTLKVCNNGNNRLKAIVILSYRCFKSVTGGDATKKKKQNSIDHVLPSGVGWETSVAMRAMQCCKN